MLLNPCHQSLFKTLLGVLSKTICLPLFSHFIPGWENPIFAIDGILLPSLLQSNFHSTHKHIYYIYDEEHLQIFVHTSMRSLFRHDRLVIISIFVSFAIIEAWMRWRFEMQSKIESRSLKIASMKTPTAGVFGPIRTR